MPAALWSILFALLYSGQRTWPLSARPLSANYTVAFLLAFSLSLSRVRIFWTAYCLSVQVYTIRDVHRQQWNFRFAYFKWSGKCLSGYLIFNHEHLIIIPTRAHTHTHIQLTYKGILFIWKPVARKDGRGNKKYIYSTAIHSTRCVHLSWKSQPVQSMNDQSFFRSFFLPWNYTI